MYWCFISLLTLCDAILYQAHMVSTTAAQALSPCAARYRQSCYWLSTVGCHYNMTQIDMILQWQKQNLNQRVNLQKNPHIPLTGVSCGVSFVRIVLANWVHFNSTALQHIDGLVQERCNSIANALELHLPFTNPLICRFLISMTQAISMWRNDRKWNTDLLYFKTIQPVMSLLGICIHWWFEWFPKIVNSLSDDIADMISCWVIVT